MITTRTSGPLFLQNLDSARIYSGWRSAEATLGAIRKFLPLILLAAFPYTRLGYTRPAHAGPARNRPFNTGPDSGELRESVRFVAVYLVLALGVGALAAGGEGVVRNAFFDLLIASCLGAALGLQTLASSSRTRRVRGASATPALIAFLGLGIATHALISLPGIVSQIRHLDELERDTRATVRMIASHGAGHAACETLELCYWAHNAFTVDFFNYGQKLETGVLPMSSCISALKRGDFPVLQLEARDTLTTERLSLCSREIPRYYAVLFRSRIATLLTPRRALIS